LSGADLSSEATANMTPEALNEVLNLEAAAVKIPYLIIGIVVLAVAVLIYFSKLPEIKEEDTTESKGSGKSIWRHSHLIQGVITQFFYVGAQVCVSSFFIRYAGSAAGMAEKTAAFYLAIALFGFMIGRFIGTFLMQYVAPTKLLTIYAVICMVLLGTVVGFGGIFSIYALVGVEFFMSIMFPTIFSLSVKSLGEDTKMGSSLVIMSIVGGALFPLLMGKMSDQSGIQIAYIVPLICFLMVAWFGWRGHTVKQS
jgi:FHS family L-fucose permease-like MFS transporter